VLDIDDIITFHGESIAEFEQAFQASVDDYIKACEQLGQPAEKAVSGRLMLRIAPTVHAAAIKAAANSGQSMNKWVEHLLSRALNISNSTSTKTV
jgi:predicted HicB family RNase H-like nuclease